MYVTVQLLNGFTKKLIYKVPSDWPNQLLGMLVEVPLQKRLELAIIVSCDDQMPNVSFAIREAHSLVVLPQDDYYRTYVEQLAAYSGVELLHFYQRLLSFLKTKELEEHVPAVQASSIEHQILTDEQQAIVDYITPAIHQGYYQPTVIHGVTGGGKTEVYKKLIMQAYAINKSALLLLPEVSLAIRFTALLREQLPNIAIFGFHSSSGVKEKRALWQALLEGEPMLIIGVHLPILLPVPRLGLIIIDEEHEVNYQEKKYPKINTKEAAILRAHVTRIPIVLGSATPSLSSLYNVEQRGWRLFAITKRFSGNFPLIQHVLLTKDKRKNFWISKELERAIGICIAKREQAIIFLNRRGYSFFVQCKECAGIITCSACSVSLTLHQDSTLRCHYCGFFQMSPDHCPECRAPEKALIKKGIGTQQVVTVLEKMFPTVRIARADIDSTVNKKKWQATVEGMYKGEIDILVGTQTITKGYHFPRVTLVGVIWADSNLGFPSYNAAEVTLQQLVQVAGRAGRTQDSSLVIVQSLLAHPIFNFLEEQKYKDFYTYEIAYRKQLGYPPYTRFSEFEIRDHDEEKVEQIAHACNEYIRKQNDITLQVLGPSRPPVHKINHEHIRKMYIKSPSAQQVCQLYKKLQKLIEPARILFTQNPLQ